LVKIDFGRTKIQLVKKKENESIKEIIVKATME
jgi:hypothetical protein